MIVRFNGYRFWLYLFDLDLVTFIFALNQWHPPVREDWWMFLFSTHNHAISRHIVWHVVVVAILRLVE